MNRLPSAGNRTTPSSVRLNLPLFRRVPDACGAFLSHAWDRASPSRSPPRLPLQVSGPEQKTQQLPLLFPHEPEHIARSQALCRFARIGLHAPSQKFTPPRRQPMPARRIPKKPYRSKQSLNPPSECKSPPAAASDPTLTVILVHDCLIAMRHSRHLTNMLARR